MKRFSTRQTRSVCAQIMLNQDAFVPLTDRAASKAPAAAALDDERASSKNEEQTAYHQACQRGGARSDNPFVATIGEVPI